VPCVHAPPSDLYSGIRTATAPPFFSEAIIPTSPPEFPHVFAHEGEGQGVGPLQVFLAYAVTARRNGRCGNRATKLSLRGAVGVEAIPFQPYLVSDRGDRFAGDERRSRPSGSAVGQRALPGPAG